MVESKIYWECPGKSFRHVQLGDIMQDNITRIGRAMFDSMRGTTTGAFNKSWWIGKVMEWTMKRPEFKVAMFRFVDVLPYLHSNEQIAKHLRDYFMTEGSELPPVLQWGIGSIAGTSIGARIAGMAIKKNIEQMARQFIVGENPQDAIQALQKIVASGSAFTVDLLGEVALSESEAMQYQQDYMTLLTVLHKEAPRWKGIDAIRQPLNISVKLSSLYSQIDPIAFDHSVARLKERLLPIFQRGKSLGFFVNLDMESYAHKDITLEVFRQTLSDPSMSGYSMGGIAIQAYQHDSENDVKALIDWCKRSGIRATVRLVKGAYWDFEVINAAQKGWPCPVFTHKSDTDANFERITSLLLENNAHMGCAIASHNARSIAYTMARAQQLKLTATDFEFQVLYGMAEPIEKAIREQGYQVRNYAPVGALIPGMAYLVRRLLENTSNESWLRASFADAKQVDELLAAPHSSQREGQIPHNRFHNCAPLDFIKAPLRSEMQKAVDSIQGTLEKHYPLRIGGKTIDSKARNTSINPTHPDQIVGTFAMADIANADAAVDAAVRAFKEWRITPVPKRTEVLRKAAMIFQKQRMALAALQTVEVGKTWAEADADVCEAIDFLNYYADEMERIANGDSTGSVPGEHNWYHYVPRGVGIVIAPWNFPLAISTGMVAAALVTGNTVIYKPSEQATVIGARMVAIFEEAGLPAGALNFLPGKGSVIGQHLIEHPSVAFVTFTGSKEVGLSILRTADRFDRGQTHVKKIVAEMGGKNAIIVDADADLDEAITGVMRSAFGFSGQKCSACSRAIVLEENYDRFVARLVDATSSIMVGDPINPATAMGPVIEAEAQKKILEFIEIGKRHSHLAYEGTCPSNGFFVPPTIFTNVLPDHTIARDEIFGPVLAVMKAKTFEEALQIANAVQYGLTGGLYSRLPSNIELAKRDFEVGNLYINRPCTGAIVQRHPFGGFKLSGVGSKAGGPDYLLQFIEPRNISENTMRRGFAPEILDISL